MNSFTKSSDTLLRPDIGLLLPFVAAASHNFHVILLAAAAQPLKWQSGCACFTQLCHKKRTSLHLAPVILAISMLAHYALSLPVNDAFMLAFAFVVAMLSFESVDCKVLKAVAMTSALTLPPLLAVLASGAATALYACISGWSLRMFDSSEILASNDMWLITRDIRLAKRVNLKGEYHLEYATGDDVILVGDGRLIGKGNSFDRTLPKAFFVSSVGNTDAIQAAMRSGAVVENDDRLVIN